MSVKIICTVFAMFLYTMVMNAGNALWWEGESSVKNDFVKSKWLDTDIRQTRLSNMNWLSCYVKKDNPDKKKIYIAEYEINVPENSDYTFWVRELYRKNASPWKFRFDDGKWTQVTKKHAHIEGSITNLGRDRSIVWCKYGTFKLSKGKHKFEIQISERSQEDFQAGFDSFLLTDVPFTPEGWQKPQVLAKYGYIGTFFWLEGEDAKKKYKFYQ